MKHHRWRRVAEYLQLLLSGRAVVECRGDGLVRRLVVVRRRVSGVLIGGWVVVVAQVRVVGELDGDVARAAGTNGGL